MDKKYYLDISVIKVLCIANEISAQLHHKVITEQVFYASLFLTRNNIFHKSMLTFGYTEDEIIDYFSRIFFVQNSFLESKYNASSLKIGDITFYVKESILDALDKAANLAIKSNRSKIDLAVLNAIFTEKYPKIMNRITKKIIAHDTEKENHLHSTTFKKSLPQIPFLLIILNGS